MTQCVTAFMIVRALPIPSTSTKPSESSKRPERKPSLAPSFGFVVSRRAIGTLSYQSPMDGPFVEDFGSLDIVGDHIFTDGSGGAETPASDVSAMVLHGSFPTVASFTHWEEELAFCMAETSQWQGPNSSQKLKPSDCPEKLRGKSSSGPIACL